MESLGGSVKIYQYAKTLKLNTDDRIAIFQQVQVIRYGLRMERGGGGGADVRIAWWVSELVLRERERGYGDTLI